MKKFAQIFSLHPLWYSMCQVKFLQTFHQVWSFTVWSITVRSCDDFFVYSNPRRIGVAAVVTGKRSRLATQKYLSSWELQISPPRSALLSRWCSSYQGGICFLVPWRVGFVKISWNILHNFGMIPLLPVTNGRQTESWQPRYPIGFL